ncbi:unnamed protein product [Oikopleura dioica]|uniref:Uncharacterized protein n=1 Tax=Oikopleura dioica TaxID=34765 RepID=E4XS40_OIKDI|nr:unnamed protein product [Oikopleura dioica]
MKLYGHGVNRKKALVHWAKTTSIMVEAESKSDLIFQLGAQQGKIDKFTDAVKIIVKGKDLICFRVRCVNELIRCIRQTINPVCLDKIALMCQKSIELYLLNEMELSSIQFKNFAKSNSVIPSGLLSDFFGGNEGITGTEGCMSPLELMNRIRKECTRNELDIFEEKYLGQRLCEIDGIGDNWLEQLECPKLDLRALTNLAMNTEGQKDLLRIGCRGCNLFEPTTRKKHIVLRFHYQVEILLGPRNKAYGSNQPLNYVHFRREADHTVDQYPIGYQHGACIIPAGIEEEYGIQGTEGTHHNFVVPRMEYRSPFFNMAMFVAESLREYMMRKINCFHVFSPIIFLDKIKFTMTLKRWDAVFKVVQSQEITKLSSKLYQFHCKLESYALNKTYKRPREEECSLHSVNWEMLSTAKPINGRGLDSQVWRNGWRTIVRIIEEGGDFKEEEFIPSWMDMYEIAGKLAERLNVDEENVVKILPGFKNAKDYNSASLQNWISGLPSEGPNLWNKESTRICSNKNCAGYMAEKIFNFDMIAQAACKNGGICVYIKEKHSDDSDDSKDNSLADTTDLNAEEMAKATQEGNPQEKAKKE